MPSEIIYLLSLLYTSVCLQQPPQPRGFVFVLSGGEQGRAEGGEQVSDPYLPSRSFR